MTASQLFFVGVGIVKEAEAAESSCQVINRNFTLQASKSLVKSNSSTFDIYTRIDTNGQCDTTPNKFDFAIYLYDRNSSIATTITRLDLTGLVGDIRIKGTYDPATKAYYAYQPDVSISNFYKDRNIEITDIPKYRMYSYPWNNELNDYVNLYSPAEGLLLNLDKALPEETTPINVDANVQKNTAGSLLSNKDTVPFDEIWFRVNISGDEADKFKNFYRISNDGYIAVPKKPTGGRTQGERENEVKKLSDFQIPTVVGLSDKSSVNTLLIGSPGSYLSYRGIGSNYSTVAYLLGQTSRVKNFKFVNIEETLKKDKEICAPSPISTTQYVCSGSKVQEVIGGQINSLDKTKLADLKIPLSLDGLRKAGVSSSKDGDIKILNILPTLVLESDWKQWAAAVAVLSATNGGASPIYTQNYFSPAGFSYALDQNPDGSPGVQKIYFQIYKDQATLEANKDAVIPELVPEYKDVVTGNTQSSGSKDLKTTLYDFVIRIISIVITFLMDAIYGIFAFLVVPIIKALLLVRPYQDRFVNVIYPGWLILRNLANIFFIVSLLVVGLRILFQQSAAGAARSFIIRLMLMALLVNFSLVISQGFVGIADTVQSQFFPANSRVLEALGQKLMVDPLKTFRSTTANDTAQFDTTNAQTSLSSTLKPLVLLMLSVAAFFAFIAVAAFLAVRLVVLWVLYMVSPIAYVGFVMDETKGYAKQWWNEFFKYLIMTPVLAFFLNIAALSATLFSGNSSSLFPVDQGIAGDVVANALTTITHFITLGFIFAGMKFALSSGTIGSKTIVNYAQKGFNAVMTKPAKWAADATRSAAKTQWDRRFKGGMLDPFAHVEAYKELRDEKTKQAIDKRIASKANKLTPKGMQKDKLRALKYMLRGGSFATDNMSAEKSALEEKASILTQKEKAAMEDRYTTGSATLEENQKLLELLKNGNISKKAAQEKIIKGIDDQTAELEKERDTQVSKLRRDSEAADKKGDTDLADSFKEELEKQKEQYNDRIGHLASAKKAVQDRIDESSGDDILFDEGLKAEIGFAFDSEKFQSDLKDEIAKVNQDKLSLETNELLKKKYGLEFMDVNERKKLLDKAREIDKSISDHIMPAALGVRNARLAREAEAAKNIAHLEGEELRLAFAKAMEDNNMDLAAAIGKKVAQEGEFDELLKMNGYKNNVEDFHKFINKSLASLGPSVRAQVGSEISSLAEKNGNMAIGKAYQVSNGHLTSRNMQEHERKVNSSLAKKAPGDVVKMKPNEMAKQNASGGHSLFQGIIDNFSRMNPDKLRDLKKKMSAETASFITKSDNFQYLSPAAKAAVIEAAGKYR